MELGAAAHRLRNHVRVHRAHHRQVPRRRRWWLHELPRHRRASIRIQRQDRSLCLHLPGDLLRARVLHHLAQRQPAAGARRRARARAVAPPVDCAASDGDGGAGGLPTLWLRDMSSISFLSLGGILMSLLMFVTVAWVAAFGGVEGSHEIPALRVEMFPENKDFLLTCIGLYVVFNALLQFISYTKEKNAFHFTHPRAVSFVRFN
ncbi:uncharacterized protein LOC121987437 [Zingiber officinale]|uniref:uncharacterized protein LOC121987437 n=1 Tax=Zingiber officinale TaxID=94328 RepID=UPI001C4DCD44|nr:uncharacterized protein LOC121987437 [Zingiber officinale]